MSTQVCLLCLQVFDKDDTAANSRQKVRIETLCQMLNPNYKSSHEFQDDEMCDFCSNCYPLFSAMEEFKRQISLLEEKIGLTAKQILTTISETSSIVQNSDDDDHNGRNKIVQIRNMILSVTGESEQHDDENFVPDEFQIKLEDEADEGDMDDQFFNDDDYNSYSLEASVKEESEEEPNDLQILQEEDDIVVSCQKRSRGRPKLTQNKVKASTKRKTEDSSSTKQPSKRVKLNPRINQRSATMKPTRSSLRTKKQPTPPKGVKTHVASLKRIPTDRISNSESSEEEDVTKSNSDNDQDDDWTPKNNLTGQHRNVPGTPAFRNKTERTLQLQRVHKASLYQCQICQKKCRRKNELAAHMVIRHEKGEKNFSCNKCDKRFCLKENFDRHLKLHVIEGIKPFVCDVCDARFEKEERRDRHAKAHDKRSKFVCDQCGKGWPSKAHLETHKRTHTGERPEKCSHCDASFAHKVTLARHIGRDHSTGPAMHICHICGKGFHLASDLKTHLGRHDGKLRVKCDKCDETFAEVYTLQTHLVKVHGHDPVVCDECNASFGSLSGLKRHKIIHTGNKKHKCDTCDASFLRPVELKSHVRSHTGERPFLCPHCEKAFTTRPGLREHVQRIHTPGYVAPTPHKCPQCEKGFESSFVLEGHIRQAHSGERPFVCGQCGKGFAIKWGLTIHLKGAHGIVTETKERLPRSRKDVEEKPDL